MKKIYSLILILSILLLGCENKDIISKQNSTNLSSLNDQSKIVSDFYKLKDSNSTTMELGDFITEYISTLNPDQATDLIIELLMLQTYDKSIQSGKIYEIPEITSVYASNFNYVWDINIISQLEDSNLKSYFTDLSRSYYKINTHKNYLDVDVDYDRLSQFTNLLPELKRFIAINQAKRNLLLDASIKGEFDYKALRDNILELETFLNNYPNTKLLFESESLYRSLVSMYFIGSDGLDPYDYENKKFKKSFYDTTTETSTNYPLTMISELSSSFLSELDNKNEYKNIDYVSLISNYRKMGLKNENKISTVTSEKTDQSSIFFPKFSSFKDSNVQKIINNDIETAVDSIKSDLEWEKNDNTKYNISYFVNYGSYKYISIQLTGSSYNRKTKENITIQKNFNFDITSGKNIPLSDLLGVKFKDYKDEITSLIKENTSVKAEKLDSFEKLSKEPLFMISNLSLILYFDKGEYGFDEEYPIYIYINHDKINEFINFRDLYK